MVLTMWHRFWSMVAGWFGWAIAKAEDPEVMLDQAQRDMQAMYQANKEKAISALAAQKQLEATLSDAQKKSANLENQAAIAVKQGNQDLGLTFMREKMSNDAMIAQLQTSYDQAKATVDHIKIAIKQQEADVRQKANDALVLKTQWKGAQVQNSISKALDGMSFENTLSGFGAAQEKVKQATAEASARSEMHDQSLSAKVANIYDAQHDQEAEEALAALSARLGMAPKTPEVEQPEIERVIARVNGQ